MPPAFRRTCLTPIAALLWASVGAHAVGPNVSATSATAASAPSAESLTAHPSGPPSPPEDLAAPSTAPSTSPDDSPNDSPADSPDDSRSFADSTRDTVRSSVEWLASGVDSWFGDIPFSNGGKITGGEIGLSVYRREDRSANTAFRFKARLHLPNLASYQYVFVGNDDRRDIVTDQPDAFTRQQQLLRTDERDNAFFAGVGAMLRESLDLRLGLRGGLKPYAQARYRHHWEFSPQDRLEFRETLFYSADDRLGSTTALSYEHSISSTLSARWLNSLTMTQDSEDAAWQSNLGVYRSFGQDRLLSLEALMGGVIGNAVAVADYGLQAKWSQPIHKDFVIGEVIVGHFWPRAVPTRERDRAWAIGTGIRLRF